MTEVRGIFLKDSAKIIATINNRTASLMGSVSIVATTITSGTVIIIKPRSTKGQTTTKAIVRDVGMIRNPNFCRWKNLSRTNLRKRRRIRNKN